MSGLRSIREILKEGGVQLAMTDMLAKEPLRVSDAHISTAAVEIQVIRIGSKQMTLAVFRQLPHRHIFDSYGKLLAPPWGWVNYDHDYGVTPFIFSWEGALYRFNVNLKAEWKRRVIEHKEEIEVPDPKWDGDRYSKKKVWKSTGDWYLHTDLDRDIGAFCCQAEAQEVLAERCASLTILEAAPQLFIAV